MPWTYYCKWHASCRSWLYCHCYDIYCLRAYSLGLPVIIVLQVNFIMNHKGKEAVLQISFQWHIILITVFRLLQSFRHFKFTWCWTSLQVEAACICKNGIFYVRLHQFFIFIWLFVASYKNYYSIWIPKKMILWGLY